MLVAGVDSSTQGSKVVIVEASSGKIVRSGYAAHPPGTEVPPEKWWAALQAAIADAGGLDDVEAISVAAQQHGLVALDRDGRPVRNALMWNDTRSAQAAKDLCAEFGGPAACAERFGLVPVASFTACKLRWMRDHEPRNARRVAAVALPHDYLTWRLLGYGPEDESQRGVCFEALVTDRSDASGTLYYSATRNKYDFEAFEIAFGRPAVVAGSPIPGVVIPRVLEPNEKAGVMLTGTVVGPGAGDNAAAALVLAREGDVIVSIGTSGAVFAPVREQSCDPSGTVCGFADASGGQLPLACTLNGAPVLDAAARLLNVNHEELADLALISPPGASGLVLIPYFAGERTPNLPDAKAALQNVTFANFTRPNLARAFVEGLLCGLVAGIEAVQAVSYTAKRIVLIGGGATSRAVQRCAPQVFGLPVTVPTKAEYVALGAAFQAAWVLGSKPNWTISQTCSFDADLQEFIYSRFVNTVGALAL